MRPRALLAWAVMLMGVICHRVCPLVVVAVLRVVLMGFVWVANITYAVGSAIEMTKLVKWVELSFLAWERMKAPSGAAQRRMVGWVCAAWSSWIEVKKAMEVCRACLSASAK